MNARVAPLRSHALHPARVALLGTGTVGSAAWARLASWAEPASAGHPLAGRLSLVHVANSRFAISNRNGISGDTRELLLRNAPRASSLDAVGDALSSAGTRIVIDATASETVAERHAQWLAAGISDGLLRLSVGIEHADDLVADIAAALQRAQDAAGSKRKVAR